MPLAGGWFDQPTQFVKAHALFKDGAELYRRKGKETNAVIHTLIRGAQAAAASQGDET